MPIIFVLFALLAASLSVDAFHRISFVTGASGYLGREIVHELLRTNNNEDQKIICLVRSGRVQDETNYWKEFDNSDCTIDICPYDMLDDGSSLDAALCDALKSSDDDDSFATFYHVASVFRPTDNHTQTALDNVVGTENVIRSLAKHKKKLKLVVTSSMAAVRATDQEPQHGPTYCHLDWNTLSELGKNWGSSYQWSKMESERRAWELSKEYNLPMTSLCPSFVFGPPSSSSGSSSYSISLVKQWIHGESEVQSRLCVDVRDVAKAHVIAGQSSSKTDGERIIVSTERRLTSQATAEVLKQFSPTPDKITYDSTFTGGAFPIGEREVDCEQRLQELLGITLTPSEKTFADMGEMLQSS